MILERAFIIKILRYYSEYLFVSRIKHKYGLQYVTISIQIFNFLLLGYLLTIKF